MSKGRVMEALDHGFTFLRALAGDERRLYNQHAAHGSKEQAEKHENAAAALRELRDALELLGTGGTLTAIQGAVEGMAVESPWSGFADAAVGIGRLARLLEAE